MVLAACGPRSHSSSNWKRWINSETAMSSSSFEASASRSQFSVELPAPHPGTLLGWQGIPPSAVRTGGRASGVRPVVGGIEGPTASPGTECETVSPVLFRTASRSPVASANAPAFISVCRPCWTLSPMNRAYNGNSRAQFVGSLFSSGRIINSRNVRFK